MLVVLPTNSTDCFQQLNICINKVAKDLLRDKFRCWYVEDVSRSLQNEPAAPATDTELKLSNIGASSFDLIIVGYRLTTT